MINKEIWETYCWFAGWLVIGQFSIVLLGIVLLIRKSISNKSYSLPRPMPPKEKGLMDDMPLHKLNPCISCKSETSPAIEFHPCYVSIICMECENTSSAFLEQDLEAAIAEWNHNNPKNTNAL